MLAQLHNRKMLLRNHMLALLRNRCRNHHHSDCREGCRTAWSTGHDVRHGSRCCMMVLHIRKQVLLHIRKQVLLHIRKQVLLHIRKQVLLHIRKQVLLRIRKMLARNHMLAQLHIRYRNPCRNPCCKRITSIANRRGLCGHIRNHCHMLELRNHCHMLELRNHMLVLLHIHKLLQVLRNRRQERRNRVLRNHMLVLLRIHKLPELHIRMMVYHSPSHNSCCFRHSL
jgi:hypothetical protein